MSSLKLIFSDNLTFSTQVEPPRGTVDVWRMLDESEKALAISRQEPREARDLHYLVNEVSCSHCNKLLKIYDIKQHLISRSVSWIV